MVLGAQDDMEVVGSRNGRDASSWSIGCGRTWC